MARVSNLNEGFAFKSTDYPLNGYVAKMYVSDELNIKYFMKNDFRPRLQNSILEKFPNMEFNPNKSIIEQFEQRDEKNYNLLFDELLFP